MGIKIHLEVTETDLSNNIFRVAFTYWDSSPLLQTDSGEPDNEDESGEQDDIENWYNYDFELNEINN